MDLIQLTSDYEMKPFDCGDTQLNGFLLNDARLFHEKKLATTYSIKHLLKREPGHSSFRFLTVDAYLDAIPFYERNGFEILDPQEKPGNTCAMFFDMMKL